MKRKLRRDGSEIHTVQILLVLFLEYASTEIQVFEHLNCFSPLNLTTSSSPQRYFTRDVKSYLYASERGTEGLRFDSSWEVRISLCPTLVIRPKKPSFSISLPSSKLTISLIFYLQTLCYRHCWS